MKNEIYHLVAGKQVGRFWWGQFVDYSMGQPASVDFNYNYVMNREDKHHDVIGFYHTHPNFSARPSSIDYATMGAWTLSFGRPLLCAIDGVDGLKGHWFYNDELPHSTHWIKRCGKYLFGSVPPLDTKYCGCYYCESIYLAGEIKEYVDEGRTALCPRCSIDSVITLYGGNSRRNRQVLADLNYKWFSLDTSYSAADLREMGLLSGRNFKISD